MSPKKTFVWVLIAGALFAFIYIYKRNAPAPTVRPLKVLAGLKPEAVTSILIRPSGPVQLQIRVDLTNNEWLLTQPLLYRAQQEKVRKLLAFLDQLQPAPYITGSEIRAHPNADEEFGFAAPKATIVLQQGGYAPRLRVGALTNPGDQIFLQVEGDLGAYVVDAQLLKYLPRSADDWRDPTFLDLAAFSSDRLAVTNNTKGDPGRGGLLASSSTFVLQSDPTNQVWRMVWPLDARANNSRIQEALKKLESIRIRQFVSDDPKTDMEPFGLAPPELELGFAGGTNGSAVLQFGRSPSNDLTRVYARRAGQIGIVTVDKELVLPWCSFLNDFRDPHLLSLTDSIDNIEMSTREEHATLEQKSDGSWIVQPGELPADPNFVQNLVSVLTNLEIVKFVNDVVNPADLPEYGLAPALYHLSLRSHSSSGSASNNAAVCEIDFGLGTNSQQQVFAKRNDESSVYTISTNDFKRLPSTGWQLRDRKLCRFPLTDVTGLSLRQRSKVSRMIRNGPLNWSFAPGSQGIINEAAIEETVRGVIEIAAISWAGRGTQSRAGFGLTDDSYHLTIEFKGNEKFDLELGGEAPSGNLYACVQFDGQPWYWNFHG